MKKSFILSNLAILTSILIFALSGPNYLKYKQEQKEIKQTVSDMNDYLAANPTLTSGDTEADSRFAEAYKRLTSMPLTKNILPEPASTTEVEPLIARVVRVETLMGALSKNFDEYKAGQPSLFVTGFLCPFLLLVLFELIRPSLEKSGNKISKHIHGRDD